MPLTSNGAISFLDIANELSYNFSNEISADYIQSLNKFTVIPTAYNTFSLSNMYGQAAVQYNFFRLSDSSTNFTMSYNTTDNSYTTTNNATSALRYANFIFTQCNNSYSNIDRNYMGGMNIQNINTSNWLRHFLFQLTHASFSSGNFDFDWQVVRSLDRTSNTFYLYNAYQQSVDVPLNSTGVGGWFLGYSNDKVLISNNTNYITKWTISPIDITTLNIKPMAFIYATFALNAKDLLGTYGNSNFVTRWGKFTQPTTTSAPVFYTSGGWLNRPYVQFWSSGNFMRVNQDFPANFLDNTVNNRYGVTSSNGFSYFILCNLYGTAANQRLMNFTTDTNVNSGIIWQRNNSHITDTYMAVRFNGNLAVSQYSQIMHNNVWKVYSMRYRQSDGQLILNSTGAYSPNYYSTHVFRSYPSINTPSNIVNMTFNSNVRVSGGPMNLDSLYFIDSFVDDEAALQIMNTMITGGNVPVTNTINHMTYYHTMDNTLEESSHVGYVFRDLILITGTTVYTTGPENGKGALDLSANSTDGTLTANVSYSIETRGSFVYNATYSIWVKQTAAMTNGNGCIIAIGANARISCYVTTTSSLVLAITLNGAITITSSNINLLNTWNHVVFVLSNQQFIALYVNGQQVAYSINSFDYSSVSNTITRINIGQFYNLISPNTGGFPGHVANFKYYPFVLSDAQIQELYYSTQVNIPNQDVRLSFGTSNVNEHSNILTNVGAQVVFDFDRRYVLQTGPSGYMRANTYDITTNYTKMMWVFPLTNLMTNQNILSTGTTTNQPRHYFWYNSIPYITAGHSSSNSINNYVTDPSPTSPNTWTHFAVTYDNTSTTMTLYRNGSNVALTTNSQLNWSGGLNVFSIGAFNTVSKFTGYVDNVRLFSRAITEWEVKYIYGYEANNPRVNNVL